MLNEANQDCISRLNACTYSVHELDKHDSNLRISAGREALTSYTA